MTLSKTLLLVHFLLGVSTQAQETFSFQGDGSPDFIIGGEEAQKGVYSYAVALDSPSMGGQFCAGSLVAPDIVLSAAHCSLGSGRYSAIIGRHDLRTNDGDEVIVKSEILHPSYQSTNDQDNDYMILVLDRNTTANVELVQLSQQVVPVGTSVTAIGWGDTNPIEAVFSGSNELRETDIFVISNEDCKQSNGIAGGIEFLGFRIGGTPVSYENYITEDMLCAEDDGKDSCQGDSGGPLLWQQESGDHLQVGVVSWGIGCAQEAFPGVYARVSTEYNWIRQQVCNESSDPPSYLECHLI